MKVKNYKTGLARTARFAMALLLTLMTATAAWADDTYTSYTVTAGIGNTYGDGSNWTKLLDNNTESKWCCLLGNGIYVEFNTPTAIIPTGYILTTAEDTQTYPNRNPTAWVLYGKRNQGDAWTLLDSKTNYTSMPASNHTDVSFSFSNSQAYKYFRFEVSAVSGLQNNDQYNNQPAYKFQLAELRLRGYIEASNVPYLAYSPSSNTFESLTAASCLEVTSATETMGAADTETWYVVNSDFTVNSSRIEVLGTVNLILADGKTMRAEKGLHVPDGVTLNIYGQSNGTGKLYSASTENQLAGIGGNNDQTSGIITIHGGTIEAYGNYQSAGIGGGRGGNGGTTTIYGGTINATGGNYGAGIGGGVGSNCGIVTIIGGTVIAKAGKVDGNDNSQAIGNGAGTSISGGTLVIDGIKVYNNADATTPVAYANRISTCHSKYAKMVPCSPHNYVNDVCTYCCSVTNVPVTYLTYQTSTQSFTAQAVNQPTMIDEYTTTMGAAGTETWYAVRRDVSNSNRIEVLGTVHLILCDGKKLTASKGITVNNGNTLNIHGQTSGTGVLNATGSLVGGPGTESAAVGSTGSSGSTTMGSITIHGGKITAIGTEWSAGIGGGIRGGGGSITIYGGTVNATGKEGDSEAIGHGSSGADVTRTLADGLRVIYNNTIVDYGDRLSTLSQKTVIVEPCTGHTLGSNNKCTYCGLTCYTVTYNGNNATGGTVPAEPIYYGKGQTVTVLGNTGNLVRTGYTFGGWNTQANGRGSNYAPGATFTFSGTTTLYAKWEARQMELANNAGNGDAINTAAGDGMYYDVTLTDRTLYKDGDWNTLCLPFALSSFTGTPLEGATVKTLESTAFSNGTLTMNFSNDLTSIEAGKPYIVKWDEANFTIRSSADWSTFASNVGNYQNKTVKLAADISVSSMVTGTFKGTLDGCGHTITLSLTSGSNAEEIALFKTLENATIKNLKIAGNITFGLRRPASIAAYISGTTTIKNCWSSVNINSNSGTWVDGGAFVARVNDNATFNMSDCLFTGSITFKPEDFQGGGMVGWTQANAKAINLTNCLFAPTAMTMTKPDGKNETYIFVSGYVRGNLSGCYYNSVVDNVRSDVLKREGTYTTATGSELQALLGDGWEVSGGQVVPKMVPGIENPVFTDVTICNTTANVSTTYVDFVGTYSPVNYNDENRSVLYLGGGSNLYYPDGSSATTIGACRAYFQLNGITAGDGLSPNPSPGSEGSIKAFVLNFGDETTDSLHSMDNGRWTMDNGAWYDLSGRRVTDSSSVTRHSSLPKGIYIHNGKKVIIK